jgi:hypothetical protein
MRGWVGVILENFNLNNNIMQEEVDSRYMMYYSHISDELGNSPVVCLDGFTGWHVIREMTPEYFQEFNLKTIELNSNSNNYFCLDADGDVCNRDRCSEWYAANSWTPSNGHLNELKKKDDKGGAFGWYTKTPIMNIDEFRDYLVKRYSEGVASQFDKLTHQGNANLPQLFVDGKGFLRDKFYNLVTL